MYVYLIKRENKQDLFVLGKEKFDPEFLEELVSKYPDSQIVYEYFGMETPLREVVLELRIKMWELKSFDISKIQFVPTGKIL